MNGIRGSFQAQAFTGSASFAIPLPTSDCRGFEPQIQLTYDSAHGNGPFGMGFRLSLAEVSRNLDKRIPSYTDADTFVLSGAGELLCKSLRTPEGWKPAERQVLESGVQWQVTEYRPRVEGDFERIELWKRIDDGDLHWRTTDRDGSSHVFGANPQARLADPANHQNVLSWLLESSTDAKGNSILYEYRAENELNVPDAINEIGRDNGAQRYPNKIRYGAYFDEATALPAWHFELVFDYGERDFSPASRIEYDPQTSWPARADAFSTYRPGFELRTHRLCHAVLLYHRFAALNDGQPQLIRALRFAYEQTPRMSFLSSIAETGVRRAPSGELEMLATPPLSFNYSSSDPAFLFSLGGQFAVELKPGTVSPALRTEFRLNDLPLSPSATVTAEERGSWVINDGQREFTVKRNRLFEEKWVTGDPAAAFRLDVFDPARAPKFRPLVLEGGAAPGFIDRGGWQMVDLDNEGLPGLLYVDGINQLYWRPRGEGVLAASSSPAAFPLSQLGQSEASFLNDVAANGLLDLEVQGDGVNGFYPRLPNGSWGAFTPFEHFPPEASEPGAAKVDTTGDGRADWLIAEATQIKVYRSKGYRGYAEAVSRVKPPDWPLSVANSECEAVRFADVFGDGGSHLIRIRNGQVECWPSLGYGRFGPRVALTGAPHFAEQLNAERLFLADIDGSGTADLVYVEQQRMLVYFNQCGNGFSREPMIVPLPHPWNNIADLQFADVLGNGTACAVLGTLVEQSRVTHLFYDFTGGVKPHLLIESDNNLGAVTRIHYAPSTRFYLEDREAGRPWATRLPFPAQVIEKMEVIDQIADSRQVRRFRYHEGYYDPVERAFRGFGMIESWDGERFDLFSSPPPGGESRQGTEQGLIVAPTYSKTWYHTGAFFDRGLISKQAAAEYFNGDPEALQLPDSVFAPEIEAEGAETLREAYAALAGQVLRQEVYGADVAQNPALAALPYTVAESSYEVRLLQPRGHHKHAAFFVHSRQSVTMDYERNPNDPRTGHDLTVVVDEWGNALQSCRIVYPRRAGVVSESLNPAEQVQPEQCILRAVASVSGYINEIEQFYLLGVPCEERTFELSGLTPAANGYFSFEQIAEQLRQALENIVPFDQPRETRNSGAPQARLLTWQRQYYVDASERIAPLADALPFGQTSPQALPSRNPSAVFPATQAGQLYSAQAEEALTGAGYQFDQASGYWWNPGVSYAYAAPGDYYLPVATRDPFGATTTVTYDPENLAVIQLTDAMGNRTRAEIDYQTPDLSPRRLIDINDNPTEALYDPLGAVIATSVQGTAGQSIVGDAPLLEYQQQVNGHSVLHTPLETILKDPAAYLQNATSFFAYDLFAWRERRQPPRNLTLQRTRHVYEKQFTGSSESPSGDALQPNQIIQTISYFDGFSRALQTKQSAEPGPAWTLDESNALQEIFTDDRWLTTGRTVYNSKGAPVKQYEPYFTASPDYAGEAVLTEFGVTSILHYDPLLRLERTDLPKGYFTRIVRTAWVESHYDPNDTILESSYFAGRENLNANEQQALKQAVIFAGTPDQIVYDNLGRPFLTVQMLTRAEQRHEQSDAQARTPIRYLATRHELDIQGNVLASLDPRIAAINDARGEHHFNFVNIYDMAGNLLRTDSADAGVRWTLKNVLGSQVLNWDSRGFTIQMEYDALQRKKQVLVKGDDGRGLSLNQVVEFINYGDEPGISDARQNNLRGQPVRHYDQAGKLAYLVYGLAGELIESTRQFRTEYRQEAAWQVSDGQVVPQPYQLEKDVYRMASAFDAAGRLVAEIAPDGDNLKTSSNFRYSYNSQNQLKSVEVAQLGGAPESYVKEIAYNARGQRLEIAYGNHVVSTYEYDPLTFLLTRAASRRKPVKAEPDLPAHAKGLLQDTIYTYDPAGNIVLTDFAEQQTVVHGNTTAEPRAHYVYDSLYRLVEAGGREHPALSQPRNSSEASFQYAPRLQVNDETALAPYKQRFDYDDAGNLRLLRHTASNSARGFTRRFPVLGLQQNSVPSNRLSQVCSQAFTVDASPHKITPGKRLCETVQYDANGNAETLEGNRTLYWNYRDNISHAPSIQRFDGQPSDGEYYVYDFSGQRVRRVTQRLNQNAIEIEEKLYFGTLEILRRRVAAKDQDQEGSLKQERKSLQVGTDGNRVAIIHNWTYDASFKAKDQSPSQQIRYQLGDHLDSVTVEVDQEARLLTYEEYYPYGGTSLMWGESRTNAALKQYRYSGKERDETTGLYYYGARYYAPWLCRWLSPDPAWVVDGLNLYAFVSGNPVNLVDVGGMGGKRKRENIKTKANKKKKLSSTEQREKIIIENATYDPINDPFAAPPKTPMELLELHPDLKKRKGNAQNAGDHSPSVSAINNGSIGGARAVGRPHAKNKSDAEAYVNIADQEIPTLQFYSPAVDIDVDSYPGAEVHTVLTSLREFGGAGEHPRQQMSFENLLDRTLDCYRPAAAGRLLFGHGPAFTPDEQFVLHEIYSSGPGVRLLSGANERIGVYVFDENLSTVLTRMRVSPFVGQAIINLWYRNLVKQGSPQKLEYTPGAALNKTRLQNPWISAGGAWAKFIDDYSPTK